jgi:hypothetical protein
MCLFKGNHGHFFLLLFIEGCGGIVVLSVVIGRTNIKWKDKWEGRYQLHEKKEKYRT